MKKKLIFTTKSTTKYSPDNFSLGGGAQLRVGFPHAVFSALSAPGCVRWAGWAGALRSVRRVRGVALFFVPFVRRVACPSCRAPLSGLVVLPCLLWAGVVFSSSGCFPALFSLCGVCACPRVPLRSGGRASGGLVRGVRGCRAGFEAGQKANRKIHIFLSTKARG